MLSFRPSRVNFCLFPLILLGICLILCSSIVADDLDSGTVRGIVTDPSGGVVSGATVKIRDVKKNRLRTVVTDLTGGFIAPQLPSSTYEIKVEAKGFRFCEVWDIRIESGQTVTYNIPLELERRHEMVTVTVETTPPIDLTKTVVGGNLTSREVDLLPLNGRDALDLVLLFPGVTEQPFDTRDAAKPAAGRFSSDTPIEAGVFSLSGGRAFSNNLTLDGFDNNDDREARERISYPREAVEEVQVITNQFSSEYGRASGGRVNLRTRSGSNQFHGRGYFFFQDESLNANSFFRNSVGQPRVPFQRRQEGFFLSGPIHRDQIFFFGSFERDDKPDTAEINLPLPFETNPRYPLPQPNSQGGSVIYRPANGAPILGGRWIDEVATPSHRNFIATKMDALLNQKNALSVRYDFSRGSSLSGFTGGARFPSTAVEQGRDSQSWALTEDFVVRPHLTLQSRYQYSRLLPSSLENGESQPVAVIVSGSSGFSAGGSASTFHSNRRGKRKETRNQFAENITLIKGRSTLKMGVDVQRVNSRDFDLFELNGIYTFANMADFLSNQPSRFQQAVGNPEGVVTNTVVGLYLQHDWKFRSNFSLNFGLRYDMETALSKDTNNFGPRFSFAWDPFRSGKTLVRGGFGVFYNRVLLRTFGDFAGKTGLRFIDLRTTEDVQKIFPHLATNDAARFLSDLFPRILPNSFEIFSVASPADDARRLSPNLRIPYSEQASFGIEREIRRGLIVEASYQFNHSAKLWRDHNINAPVPPAGGLLSYLLSQSFSLSLDNTVYSNVRFDLGTNTSVPTPNGSVIKTPLTLGLNAGTFISGSSSSRFVRLLFEAVCPLRPFPSLRGLDQLESSGSSSYNALTLSLTKRTSRTLSFRTSYTLSKLFEDTFINTATPQDEFNLAAERSLGNTDQRHRFLLQGIFEIPKIKITAVPVLMIASGRPFTIGNGGSDRNLSDRATDRPNLIRRLAHRPTLVNRPGETSPWDPQIFFSLPSIGTSGNLGRNVGIGPRQHRFDLALSRNFRLSERASLRPQVELFNVFNNTVFFVNGFVDINDRDFLQPRAARRPRMIQLSLRFDF